MNAITNPIELGRYTDMFSEMMLKESQKENEFSPEWVRKRGWRVVPVEDSAHFASVEIAVLVPALRKAGYDHCLAIAMQSVEPDGVPCYSLSISEEEFRTFNAECGLLRYLLTEENRNWAISCSEWYNLFAGPPGLLEGMLGKSIEEAREEYLTFAAAIAEHSDEPLLEVARHYAAL